MILVTGVGRCGSSLLMQTLHLLGVPLIGDPQEDVHVHCLWGGYLAHPTAELSIPKEIEVRARAKNPKGYWELNMIDLIEICRGKYSGPTQGRAVKLIGALIEVVNPPIVDKLIFCRRRDIARQAESQHELASIDIEIAESNELVMYFTEEYKGVSLADTRNAMELQSFMIERWVRIHKIPAHTVYFEDMLTNPAKEIENLVDFLSLEDVDITKAIGNVDKR